MRTHNHRAITSRSTESCSEVQSAQAAVLASIHCRTAQVASRSSLLYVQISSSSCVRSSTSSDSTASIYRAIDQSPPNAS